MKENMGVYPHTYFGCDLLCDKFAIMQLDL